MNVMATGPLPAAPGQQKVSVKEVMLSALQSIQASGSFAAFHSLDYPPPVDLWVIAQCRQAPYGKGSETLVDTSVRNTWELDPSRFELRGPSWRPFLNAIEARVAEDLGIRQPIIAELYKMLIYEEGAMFKPHTDTEKIPGMFGTLIICLPSAHTGGEVVVQHCGKQRTYATSVHAQSYICWYSDVTHEVRPVTSGYRWVLTYNLALSDDQPSSAVSRPSAGLLDSSCVTARLRRALERWLSQPQTSRNRSLYHVLEHDYTQASVSLRKLKADDLARVEALNSACEGLEVDIFLALLEKEEEKEADYDDWGGYYDEEEPDSEEDEIDEMREPHVSNSIASVSYIVKNLVDLEGSQLADHLSLDTDDMIDPDAWDSLDDYDEEYQGYTGNEGHGDLYWYRISAVAIVPRRSALQYFTKDSYSFTRETRIEAALAYYARECLHRAIRDEPLVDLIQQLWEAKWKTQPEHHAMRSMPAAAMRNLSGETTAMVMKVSLTHERWDLFDEVASRTDGILPISFFKDAREWVYEGQQNAERLELVKNQLRTAIMAYSRFSHRYEALLHMAPTGGEPLPSIVAWCCSILQESVQRDGSTNTLTAEDGKSIVEAAKFFHDPMPYLALLKQSVAPRREAIGFMINFVHHIYQHGFVESGKLPRVECQSLYRHFIHLMLCKDDFFEKPVWQEGQKFDKARHHRAIEHSDLFILTTCLIKASKSGEDLVTPFLSKVLADAPRFSGLDLHYIWVPYVRLTLEASVLPLSVPGMGALYRELLVTILARYVEVFVQRKPTYEINYIRPQVECGCLDCSCLNRFLVDGNQSVGQFAYGEKRRRHLCTKLDMAHIDCTHITSHERRPYKLVITKTFKQNEELIKQWKTRYGLAIGQLGQFNQGVLREMLGGEYESIVHMERLGLQEAVSYAPTREMRALGGPSSAQRPLTASIPARVNQSRSLSGTKRKEPPTSARRREDVEVVDLTSD